jgi:hypothetical protein
MEHKPLFVSLSTEFQNKYKTMTKKLENLKKGQLQNTTQRFSNFTLGVYIK